jgi:hypothetical protein
VSVWEISVGRSVVAVVKARLEVRTLRFAVQRIGPELCKNHNLYLPFAVILVK